MFFTQEDYKKIQQWLAKNSVKDTEFNEANIPFNGEETITIVQGNQNKKVFLKDLIAQVFNLGISDFVNITDKYDAPNISLEEAIRLIPSRARKEGQVITFLDRENHWHIYQFKGALNQWNVLDTWEDLFDWEKLIIDSILPDEEDLTKSPADANGNSYLSLKDRAYNPEDFSGLGRVILRKNIMEVEDPIYGKVKKNILYQDMFTQSNTIYEIRYDFDLNGEEITIPEGCVLDFQGGSFSNGSIKGIKTKFNFFIAYNIFNDTTVKGFEFPYIDVRWFGAISDYDEKTGNGTDNAVAFERAINHIGKYYNGLYIKLIGHYYIGATINTKYDVNIWGSHSVSRKLLGGTTDVSDATSPSLLVIGENVSINMNGRGNTEAQSRYSYFNIKNIKVVGKNYENSDFINILGGGGPSRVCIIEECEFTNLHNVLYVKNARDTMVGDLTISKCLAYGNDKFVYAFSDDNDRTLCNFILKDSNIEHNNEKCIHILKSFGSIIIDNNILEGQSSPIHIETTKGDISITNNYFEGNEGIVINCKSELIASTLSFERNFIDSPIDVLFSNITLTSKIPDNGFSQNSVITGIVYDIDNYNLEWLKSDDDSKYAKYVAFPYFNKGIGNYYVRSKYNKSKHNIVGDAIPNTNEVVGYVEGNISENDILYAAMVTTANFSCGFYTSGSGYNNVISIGYLKKALVFVCGKAYKEGNVTFNISSSNETSIYNLIHLFKDGESVKPSDVLVPTINTFLPVSRPEFEDKPIGFRSFDIRDDSVLEYIYWDGTTWRKDDGLNADYKKVGTFDEKPSPASSGEIYAGYAYFCTDRKVAESESDGIMIYYKGSGIWIDALGRIVK